MLKTGDRGHKTINFTQRKSEHIDQSISILLYEPYANKSSQICPFLALRAQFDSDHYQNSRLSSPLYSRESVIFGYFFD